MNLFLFSSSRWTHVLGCAGLLATAAASRGAAPVDLGAQVENWLAGQRGGAVVAYVDADGATFAAAGRRSETDARPPDADTFFEIGSVTKVFTGLLLVDAVAAGKVRLDDAVGAPFGRSAITYRQLVTHTSGLPRLPADMPLGDPRDPYADLDLKSLTASFAAAGAYARPAPAAYSNFGFAVLGQALAGVWGMPYDGLLKERVLGPLGLEDTHATWREVEAARLASGHTAQGATPHWTLNAYGPAGGMVSTARDLARFLQACLGFSRGPLADGLAAAARPLAAGEGTNRQTGYGWVVETRGAATLVWHNGGTGGFRSFVGYDAVRRVGVVVLASLESRPEPLGFSLLQGGPATKTATVATVTEATDLAAYGGNYPLAPSFVLTVTEQRGQLFVQATQQPRFALRRVAGDRFALVGVEAELVFERAAEGGVVAVVLHQNGAAQRAPRLAAGASPAAPTEVRLSAEALADYPGTYRIVPQFALTVTTEEEILFVQATGQAKVRVYASAKDAFFYKVVDARLTFERDVNGKVAAVILHQNGRELRGPREKP